LILHNNLIYLIAGVHNNVLDYFRFHKSGVLVLLVVANKNIKYILLKKCI